MSGTEPQAGGSGTKPGLGRGLTLAIAAAVIIGGAGVVYVIATSGSKQGSAHAGSFSALETGAMAKLKDVTPAPTPATPFVDTDGKPVNLGNFKGQVLVVNLWATWCGPCVKEMPTLAALQQAYAGKPVRIVAVSVDSAESTSKAKAFIADHAPLGFYQNSDLKLPFAMSPPAQEFPTTIIYDRKGTQRLRMTGDADWSSPEAKAVVDKLLAEPAAS